MRLSKYILIFLLAIISNILYAQNYPVTASLILKEGSPYVSDYIRLEDNPLQLTALSSDGKFSSDVVFRLSIKGVSISIENNNTLTTSFSVNPGSPLILTGSDLASCFSSSNLNFSGYSKAQYDSKGVLPEGLYEFSFQAYDAIRRDVAVSNKATALVWIQLHDPPQLVFPQNESIVEAKTPQQISFQWQGTTLKNVSYTLELYELRGVENRNANEVIRGSTPIFSTTIQTTTYSYTVKDPLLVEGMKYAYRVKAEQTNTSSEKSLLKNEGYSSVFAFTYLPKCNSPQIINRIPNKNGSAKINWIGEGKIYLIQYREKGQTDWYEELSTSQSITITQLRPEHTYEYRIESRCEYNKSNFTPIDTFSIPVSKNGINLTPPTGGYPDIQLDKTTYLDQGEAAPGTMIYVNHFQMKLGMAIQDERTKLYTGNGSIYVPMLKANVSVEFRNVQFNKARRLVVGLIYARQKEPIKIKIPPLKKVPQICITYGPDGYDQEGYDKEGYDRAGYNKDQRDKEGYDKNGYNAQNLDRNGKPKENPTDPLQIGQQATDPTKPKDSNTNNNTQTGTQGNNNNPNGTNSSAPVSEQEDAFTLELIDYYTELLTDYLTAHPEIKKSSGPDPYHYQKEIDLPSCLAEHREDIPYIRQYLLISKNDKTKRAELIEKMKENDSFIGFFSQAITEKKKTGNETKKYKELLSNEDWIKLAEKTCNEIYQAAGENYVSTILSDLISSDCRNKALAKAIERLKPSRGDFPSLLNDLYNYSTIGLAAITEAYLCATGKDKCQNKDYWTQYTYGVMHAIIEQADILSLTDLVKEIIQTQYENRWSCLGKETSLKIQVGSEKDIDQAIHILLKCGLGIDITPSQLQERYALTKNYIETNWQEPYFRGEATVFIATLILPSSAKAITVVRKTILSNLRKVATYSKQLSTLEALAVTQGDMVKIKQLMNKADDLLVGLTNKVDNVIDDVGKEAMEASDNLDEIIKTNNSITDPAKKFWANHEINVTKYLRQTYGNSNVGRQITVDITLKSGDVIICRLDNLIKEGNIYKIIDAKSSIANNLSIKTTDDLISQYATANQKTFYNALKNGQVQSIKPRGKRAQDFFNLLGDEIPPQGINIGKSVEFFVNDVATNAYSIYKKILIF